MLDERATGSYRCQSVASSSPCRPLLPLDHIKLEPISDSGHYQLLSDVKRAAMKRWRKWILLLAASPLLAGELTLDGRPTFDASKP